MAAESPLEAHVRKELRRYVVQKQIFCTRRRDLVLDIDTAVFILDRDGDPIAALSPEGWAEIDEAGRQVLADNGITVDTSNLPA